MNLSKPSPLVVQFQRLNRLPGGHRLFGWLVSRTVPFTSVIAPRVLELTPGFARIEMRDRKAVRNHVGSLHAGALALLGELTTGLSLFTLLPRKARAIATRMEVDFLKKASGAITSTCECPEPMEGADQTLSLIATLTDSSGDEVARVTTEWRIGTKI